ncbi:hypothetical protein DRF75_04060 [Ehrlichia minasensis]|uniref:Uncharacterized protein n=1 Tax=Ehrlichia minasensis TaxID=1242993 RepID=A0A4Q6IAZ0_9RICK|nr:hypothetical protein [Ehrlichia minasensis]RZB12468.1 hypothetical protein DRF75_04060 [Ehrlichia minasensis]
MDNQLNSYILPLFLGLVIMLLLIAVVSYFVCKFVKKDKEKSGDVNQDILMNHQLAILNLQERIKVLKTEVGILNDNFQRFYESYFSSPIGEGIRHNNSTVDLMKDEVRNMEENVLRNSYMIKKMENDMINANEVIFTRLESLCCSVESMVSQGRNC